MSNHTPEPWAYSFPKINGQEFREADCQISSGGFLIAQVSHGPIFPAEPFGSQARETNARRIVACVNACAGMETEHLENQSMLGETLLDRFNLLKIEAGKLTKQRDELLEALEAFSNYIHAEQCSTDGPVHYSDGQLTALAVMARKAIAKAKGGAA